jgi:hypothetical protein
MITLKMVTKQSRDYDRNIWGKAYEILMEEYHSSHEHTHVGMPQFAITIQKRLQVDLTETQVTYVCTN